MNNMDYEQKYKEALERARKLNSGEGIEANSGWTVCEVIFPELKKSEDEINMKQNLADEVEPKFEIKKGKWYVCIRDLLDDYANKAFFKGDIYLSTQDGSLIPSNSNVPFKVVCPDTYFRDWTIQDAKQGDVLANDHHILILKELDYDWYTNGYPYSIHAYCGIKPNGNFELGKEHWCFCGTLHMRPATSEERDLLFAKMREAGYEWDEKNKELKKTEDEEYNGEDYGIDSLFHAQRILEKTLGKVDGYQTDDGILSHKCAISAVKKLYGQKPVEWTEEDESKAEDIVYFLNTAKTHYASTVALDACIDWINSIKQRMEKQL